MPRRAAKIRCTAPGCKTRFYATRRDTLYCSDRCRYAVRMEDAKFTTPSIPKSNVPGVTFSRIRRRWEVRIKEEGKQKYVGSFPHLKSALQFHKEVTSP